MTRILLRFGSYVLCVVCAASSLVRSETTAAVNPFATRAKFAVDSEADPSSNHPELLHPRLSLSSVAATVEPDSASPQSSVIKLTFCSFSFTQADMAAARRGDTPYLERKYHAVQSTNLKSPEYNGGGWSSVQLTVDAHYELQQIFLNVPGYGILLSGADLKNLVQEYQFNGRKLIFKSKGVHRLDLKSAAVPSFTMTWDIEVTTPVFRKANAGR